MSTASVMQRLQSLDHLVDEICLTLQITPTQFQEAEKHYHAVGDWLAAPGSALAQLRPSIYPQGSMALRTTVRPREREEYDLDLVAQVQRFEGDPMVLYDTVRRRLAEHADYRTRLEPLKRCLRLSYARQFHLDILPARPDLARSGTCVEVPDRKLEEWRPSNPAGFAYWFEQRCESTPAAKAARAQIPLQQPIPEHLARPLRRAVQLMKRRRDNHFHGSDRAPRSVVLTALAGTFYRGEESVIESLDGILADIDGALTALYPTPIEVRNPTNGDELFSESWSDQRAYDAFVGYVRDFRRELAMLRLAEGLDQIGLLLDQMFGGELGQKAVRAYAERHGRAKDDSKLRFGAPGVVIGGEGRRPAQHTFHHDAAP